MASVETKGADIDMKEQNIADIDLTDEERDIEDDLASQEIDDVVLASNVNTDDESEVSQNTEDIGEEGNNTDDRAEQDQNNLANTADTDKDGEVTDGVGEVNENQDLDDIVTTEVNIDNVKGAGQNNADDTPEDGNTASTAVADNKGAESLNISSNENKVSSSEASARGGRDRIDKAQDWQKDYSNWYGDSDSQIDGTQLGGIESGAFKDYVKLVLINSDKGWVPYVMTEDDFFIISEGNGEFTLKNNRENLSLNSVSQWQNPVHKATQILNKSGYGIVSTNLIDNAYYDFNLSNIHNNAGEELEKIILLLMENPDLKIGLTAHADSRGDRVYNQALSVRRAQAARRYIVSKGIDMERVTIKGYGESRLLNNCVDGKRCSETDHEINRRTTFTIELN